MKAIFPNAQLLQPMPTSGTGAVHANVSGNINSTTTSITPPSTEPTESSPNAQSVPINTQQGEIKSSINLAPYFVCLIIIILIIFIYKKLKQK